MAQRGVKSGAVRPARQAFEQYNTWSQSRSHFLRQLNGRPQVRQTLSGGDAARRVLTQPA